MEFSAYFIISQALMFLAMIFDFFSFQFKERKQTFVCFAISAALISLHYFFLSSIAAAVIVLFSVARFITGYFTTEKRYIYIFLALNTISLIFTYRTAFDLIVFMGISINIIANFQKDNAMMRRMMMLGTSLVIIFNAIIFSPIGVLVEALFLGSNILGYYRHYVRKPR